MGALWNVLGNALTKEPRTRSVPYLWKWSDVRPRVLRSGELVTAEEAERRVLMLLNPGLPPEKMVAVGTLYAGVQLILPGEIARTHHHTPSATRFIIEGELAYSTVSGERTLMKKGDYVTTPNWTWHDHGNESDQPMLWLDGLDIPLVTELDAVFFEEWHWEHGDRDPAGRRSRPRTPPTAGARTCARPTSSPDGAYSPVLNYRWETCRAALHALRDDQGDAVRRGDAGVHQPAHGRAVAADDGGLPPAPAQGRAHPGPPPHREHRLPRRGGRRAQHHRRASASTGQEGDTFVVPSWAWHEHASVGGEAVLFSFSDRPVIEAFGFLREEALPRPTQS